jgi:uncharacterized membrane protein YgdD (TMEM256/DUF423 family)
VGAALAIRIGHPRWDSTRWIATMFMVGSALFAIASVPGYASISERASAFTYAAGSVFFTLAALEQLRTSEPNWADRWSALIQFAGTILFNVNTFIAVDEKLSPHAQDLLVWTPDAVGSACFLVASAIASYAVRERRDDKSTRRIADLNLAGSVAFGFSALASYVVDDTGELVNAAIASSGTFVGAICFLVAAWMLRRQSSFAPTSS